MVVASAGPGWTDIMTAFGTVGAVIAAVGIALWSEVVRRKEHKSDREREQVAEAYAVQVLTGGPEIEDAAASEGAPVKTTALVVNHGRYSISGLEAQLHVDTPAGTELVAFAARERIQGLETIDPDVLGPLIMRQDRVSVRPEGMLAPSNLTPWDRGIRFESDAMASATLLRCYPVVRWTDRWGTRWEYRLGRVQQVDEDDPWAP